MSNFCGEGCSQPDMDNEPFYIARISMVYASVRV